MLISAGIILETQNLNQFQWILNCTKQKRSKFKMFDNFIRRLFDVIVAGLGLICLLPLFIYVAIKIKLDSKGPVFYKGPRAGYKGKPFNILKFRTMYECSDSFNGSDVTAEDDNRITLFGKILRDNKINEFPQLLNVLIGEMSLVGPRPEAVRIAEKWPKDAQEIILSVRPGITSPASVIYRSEEKMLKSENVMEEYLRTILPSKLRLDTLYVQNRTILTDVDVMFWTAIALVPNLRNREIGENRLFWGPLSKFVTRYFNWFLIDILISTLAVIISGVIWRTSIPLNIGWQNAIWVPLAISSVFSLFNYIFGLNHVSWSRAAATDALLLGLSALFSTIILVLFKILALNQTVLPVGMIFTSGFLSFMGFVLIRYRERLLTGAASRWVNLRQGASSIAERVLIVGAGDNGELAIWLFNRSNLANAFTVYGIVDDDPRKQGMRINGVSVLGGTDQINEIVRKYDIGLIVYTIYNISEKDRRRLIKVCQKTKSRVVVLPDIMRRLHEADDSLASFDTESDLNEDLITSDWLDEISDLAESGDLHSLKLRINRMKAEIKRQ